MSREGDKKDIIENVEGVEGEEVTPLLDELRTDVRRWEKTEGS